MKTVIDQTDASFIADIPLFSSKRMLHMGTGKGDSFELSELTKKGKSASLKVSTTSEIKKAWFVIDGVAYKAKNRNGVFKSGSMVDYNNHYNSDSKRAYEFIERIVLKRETDNKNELFSPRIDPYQNHKIIHFYALTKTPDSFHSVGEISENEQGWTLNRFKLNLDGAL